MAIGEPSYSVMNQVQVHTCHFCGKDLSSTPCGGHQINYQKLVDPPTNPYTQFIPSWRYDEEEESERKKKGKMPNAGKCVPFKICIPYPPCDKTATPPPAAPEQTSGCKKNEGANAAQALKKSEATSTSFTGKKLENAPANNPPIKTENTANSQCHKKNEESGTKEAPKTEETGNSSPLNASCFPTGGGGCPPPVKMMLCLPCPAPQAVTQVSAGPSTACPRSKPTDYTYRCESRELRGGILYTCCQCIKRNGLQHDCPRTPCQGRPPCLTKPWPDCWPSGGCHGIDYSRERGFKRIDPCRDQRFDKKECRPPGLVPPKIDCGGNMMVVVCPPQN